MSFGSQFTNVAPLEDNQPLPWGQFAFKFKEIIEKKDGSGRLTGEIEFHAEAIECEYAGSVVREWIRLGRACKSDKQRDFQARKMARILYACGYADLVLNPGASKTHKPLAMLASVQALKGIRFFGVVNQKRNAKGYLNNEITSYSWARADEKARGEDANQPAPIEAAPKVDLAQSYGSPTAGYAGPDYGEEPIPELPQDYAGGYATKAEDTEDPPF